jgi:four helix bundle protein
MEIPRFEKPAYAESYRDLIVYQKSKQLALDIFRVTTSFPREEMYSLTDQIRRSSRSIGAQIAEAWAKRRYTKHFISKLSDAAGEQLETQHWIDIAYDCDYLRSDQANELKIKCLEIGRLLGAMMAKADRFCGSSYRQAREAAPEYFAGLGAELHDDPEN